MSTNTKILCIISLKFKVKKGNNPVKIHDRVMLLVKLFLQYTVHLIVNKYFKFQGDSFVSLHVSDLNPKHNILT